MRARLTSQTVYKLAALLGIVITAATPYFSATAIDPIEQHIGVLLEQRVLADLDLQSLNQQYQSLQQIIHRQPPPPASEGGDSSEAIDYSTSQIQLLRDEAEALNSQIEEAALQLNAFDNAKAAVLGDIKKLFFTALLAMTLGMVLAISGILGWYFHVRVYEERREEPRTPPTAA